MYANLRITVTPDVGDIYVIHGSQLTRGRNGEFVLMRRDNDKEDDQEPNVVVLHPSTQLRIEADF